MKTFFGVDYQKAFSYGTIMTESGKILKQGRFANDAKSVARFLDRYGCSECSAVLEATRNWCVMHDCLEELTGQVTLAHPLKVKAIAEAKRSYDPCREYKTPNSRWRIRRMAGPLRADRPSFGVGPASRRRQSSFSRWRGSLVG